MPQLDKVTFLSQFFLFCLFYLGFYYIILKYYLPKISRILALRKRKMGGSQQGVTNLQQENSQVRQQFETVFSKALTTSRTVFADVFSGTSQWLHENVSLLNKTHYKNVNQSLLDSLGEASLSQNVLFYHASNPLPEKYKVHLLVEKMKNFSALGKKGIPQAQYKQQQKKSKKSK
jgi:hypothetical protein